MHQSKPTPARSEAISAGMSGLDKNARQHVYVCAGHQEEHVSAPTLIIRCGEEIFSIHRPQPLCTYWIQCHCTKTHLRILLWPLFKRSAFIKYFSNDLMPFLLSCPVTALIMTAVKVKKKALSVWSDRTHTCSQAFLLLKLPSHSAGSYIHWVYRGPVYDV